MVPECKICGKPVPDYVAEYCCSGQMCGCRGVPIEPCVCSIECWDAYMHGTGEGTEKRRRFAGIPRWDHLLISHAQASYNTARNQQIDYQRRILYPPHF